MVAKVKIVAKVATKPKLLVAKKKRFGRNLEPC